MSAKKIRPAFGADITSDMSRRDQAAALGISVAELCRWVALAKLESDEFESRLAAGRDDLATGRCKTLSSTTILRPRDVPVPARGRVERALELWRGMSAGERAELLEALPAVGPEAGQADA